MGRFLEGKGRGALVASMLAGALAGAVHAADPVPKGAFEPVAIPGWVHGVTRMAFASPGQVDALADAREQVLHTNLVWPYYPLRKDGGGFEPGDSARLKALVAACHGRGIKLVLGLPPFPSVALVKAHPDWRVHPDDGGAALELEPREDNLGTRLGCNQGPWGDYFIELLAELIRDYGLDGYSFDGNYHPPICYCPACKSAYRAASGGGLPAKVDLDDPGYRRYLVWRGERLEDHYRRMQARIKGVDADAVLMSWTVNAGRYGQLLTSPRAMPARLNLLFDLPMQEWWLDETNQGASVAPAFGAAYLRGLTGGRPSASEPYLMARGNPYGTDSFPAHERLVRTMLAVTQGSLAPQSFGWPGHGKSTRDALAAIAERERWTIRARSLPWAALLVGEQTRQFVAYKDIAGRYLPHVFGAFRAAAEEHRPLDLVNDWDLTPGGLSRYRALVLAGSAALGDDQVRAVREYVRAGGGLVASCEASLCDELGRPRGDLALADVFGVSVRPGTLGTEGGAGTAAVLPESYWQRREGVGRLSWSDHPLVADARLGDLVPGKSATFRGPRVVVGAPGDASEVVARLAVEGQDGPGQPAIIARRFGRGRVVYLAAGVDAALWSYAYPYERRLLVRALDWAAGSPPPIGVEAPMAVQTTFFEQADAKGRRIVVHLFNGIDTGAHHGRPGLDVPLREESVPVHGIRLRFEAAAPRRFHVEPGGAVPLVRRDGEATVVEFPPLDVHAMLVGEF